MKLPLEFNLTLEEPITVIGICRWGATKRKMLVELLFASIHPLFVGYRSLSADGNVIRTLRAT